MYRVLLVDDEALARMGLRSTFDWEANGFQLVGEASNGKNALQWIDRHEVDILITDIAMPVMDGLELMRITRERCPWVKIVLLSCHSDFSFVREGVRMGASDYLLKPTLEPADLKEVLNKVKLQISEERRIHEIYIKQELSGKRIELEKAFTKLLASDNMLENANIDLPWMSGGYRFVVCMLDSAANMRSEEGGVFIEIVIEEMQESFYKVIGEGVVFRGCSDQLILVLPETAEGDEVFNQRMTSLHSMLQEREFSFTFGVSGRVHGLERIKQAIQEGRQATRLRFYEGPGKIRFYEPHPPMKNDKHESERLKTLLKELMGEGRKEKSLQCLESLFKFWTNEHRTPIEVKREAQELLSLFQMCKDNKAVPMEQTEVLRLMESVDDVRVFIRSAFEEVWKSKEETEEDYGLHRRIVGRAIEYLKSNYIQNISLQDVADHVSMSKNYFSELFKKNTGQNFIDYLIHLRLKCACDLLRTTTLKIYEVAELSGFNDVKYFSKLFKKVLKVSPADYREGKREEVELPYPPK
ncbi:response regulator [Paenibacillus filicis]|uniref:Response regulator n=1 Tax=Paenibacillus gyeongsangnamensis TaxID=3388067 RepID=A0ABT4QEM9_9BACL|nr:response regulator [Paenibacillus filicis]MCZ8515337.1 response regulator [Paenibacillus filicis]